MVANAVAKTKKNVTVKKVVAERAMTDSEKRIKLAEAIGANIAYLSSEKDILFQWPDGRRTKTFDPFTDANAVYDVLEWLR